MSASYLIMFIYIVLALGKCRINKECDCFVMFMYSKIIIGVVGIVSVVLSVSASIGLFAVLGYPASLIILEVEPFLVLAIGVDNIFIFVQSYQVNQWFSNK